MMQVIFVLRILRLVIILNKARIYVSCDNVYMWDHYDAGFSPEAATQDNASSDWAAYPLSRTFSLGVNITF